MISGNFDLESIGMNSQSETKISPTEMISQMPEMFLSQAAIGAIQKEYTIIGLDTGKIQTKYDPFFLSHVHKDLDRFPLTDPLCQHELLLVLDFRFYHTIKINRFEEFFRNYSKKI